MVRHAQFVGARRRHQGRGGCFACGNGAVGRRPLPGEGARARSRARQFNAAVGAGQLAVYGNANLRGEGIHADGLSCEGGATIVQIGHHQFVGTCGTDGYVLLLLTGNNESPVGAPLPGKGAGALGGAQQLHGGIGTIERLKPGNVRRGRRGVLVNRQEYL